MVRSLQVLADAVPALLAYVSAELKYTFANKRYRESFGWDEPIVGQSVVDVIGADALATVQPHIDAVLAGRTVSFETVVTYRRGSTREIRATYTPDLDPEGRVLGFVSVVEDITNEKALERELRQTIEHLSHAERHAVAANRAKDDFVAVVSHDLRTPLNSILGWAQMLKQGVLDEPARQKAVDTIARNAQMQAQLVNDLVDMSRVVSGQLRLDIQEVELIPVIREAVETVRPAAAAKGIVLEEDLDAKAEPILGDPVRMQQVVWNLLANAVKFTPSGGRITVCLERAGRDVRIVVRDTGQGIAADFLPFVFDRFRQGNTPGARRLGLGLGLSIVRHLVELHGGSVQARSAGEGQGSEFSVTIPWWNPKDVRPRAAGEENTPREADLEHLRVLLVEDDADNRDLLCTMLLSFKADVRAAESSREALATLREWRPDVLLSDISMPDGDGYALIKAVRSLPAEQGGLIPAVALTGLARHEDHRRALEAGYQVHIPKPASPAKVVAVLGFLRRQLPPAGAAGPLTTASRGG
jgi:PAS domain S-box-containing protein